MDPITAQALLGAAGAGGDPVYVDDVFSTYVYEGTGSAQTITNGIDLSGEGGLVWTKNRAQSDSHAFFDTERGLTKVIYSDTASAESTDSNEFTSFNSNGYSLHQDGGTTNGNGNSYCSWTFRKCPGFFDIVTYTGNNTAGRQIAHNLGSVPGSIWIKRLNGTDSWVVYHRSLGNNKYMFLNTTSAALTDNNINWNGTSPTSTHFTVGDSSGYANGNNLTYVAYIFAHDDQSFGDDGDEAVIKCDSYTGTGSTGLSVNVGFEPQFLIIKRTETTEDWCVFDNMRGVVSGGNDPRLSTNNNYHESLNAGEYISFTPTGFQVDSTGSPVGGNNGNYVYIAIRRPHKPPESATEVFAIDTKTAKSGNTPQYTSGFPVDFAIRRNNITSADSPEFVTRITNALQYTNGTSAEVSAGATFLNYFAYNNGWANSTSADSNDYLWMFKRAPGFMDVVTYTGNGVQGRNITHNLGVAPDLMIVKNRDTSNDDWHVYVSGITHLSVYGSDPDSYGNNAARLYLNGTDNAQFSASGSWDHTHPTATTFRVGDTGGTNGNGEDLVAYLFATLAGISKVGSYSGTGSDIDVDCGFTNGARFVMIKRVDASADWFVVDTARGISSGNDPYITLNTTDAQGTTVDVVNPLSSGFTVKSNGGAAINGSGGSYIFFAIA